MENKTSPLEEEIIIATQNLFASALFFVFFLSGTIFSFFTALILKSTPIATVFVISSILAAIGCVVFASQRSRLTRLIKYLNVRKIDE